MKRNFVRRLTRPARICPEDVTRITLTIPAEKIDVEKRMFALIKLSCWRKLSKRKEKRLKNVEIIRFCGDRIV